MSPLEYKLQNLPKDSLIYFLKKLIASNQNYDLNTQLLLVDAFSQNNLKVEPSFFMPEVQSIYQLLEIRDYLVPGDASSLLEELVDGELCAKYPQICYMYELSFNGKFDSEVQQFLNNNLTEFETYTEFYLAVNLLKTIGAKVDELGVDLSLSSYHNAMSILDGLDVINECPRLMADISHSLITSLESHIYGGSPLMENHLNKAEKLYGQLKDESNYEWIRLYKNQITSENNLKVSWIDFSTLNLKDKRYLATDIAFNLWEENPQLAADYIEYAISLSIKSPCTLFESVIKNYLVSLRMEIGDRESAQELINELNDFQFCNSQNLLERRFQNINYQPEVLEYLYPNYDKKILVDSLYVQRSLGDELFKDQPDHLGDFYARNAIKIFSYLSELNELDSKYKTLVLELMQNTKQREMYRLRKVIEEGDASETDKRLKELLNEIDYFNKPKGLKDPIYPEIFQLALAAHKTHHEQVEKIEFPGFNYSEIESKIENKEIQCLEFMNSVGKYVGYFYNHEGFQIFEWEQQVVDSLASAMQKKLVDKKDFNDELESLKNLINESINVDPQIPLTFIPDGPLESTPFELIFDRAIEYNYALNSKINQQDIYLSKSKASLLSFSNRETIMEEMEEQEDKVRTSTALVDRSEFAELTYGFLECKSIDQLFNEKPKIYAGSKANRKRFFEGFDQDLLHVSAHAYTNAESKYDNYIILRNEDSELEKIYSYEIETFGPSPKVVILSACQTGIGAFTEGVGTYSISRAFITNGSEAVIKTLWKINDLTTKEFMVQMYKHWLNGISLQEALNLTKSDFKKNDRYTAYDWAGFILEGNGNIYLEQ